MPTALLHGDVVDELGNDGRKDDAKDDHAEGPAASAVNART